MSWYISIILILNFNPLLLHTNSRAICLQLVFWFYAKNLQKKSQIPPPPSLPPSTLPPPLLLAGPLKKGLFCGFPKTLFHVLYYTMYIYACIFPRDSWRVRHTKTPVGGMKEVSATGDTWYVRVKCKAGLRNLIKESISESSSGPGISQLGYGSGYIKIKIQTHFNPERLRFP